MDTITETAERIAAEVRATSRHIVAHFDAGGELLGSHEADKEYLQRPDWMDRVAVSAVGSPGFTARRAQDLLDAHRLHPTDLGARQQYLHAVELEREMEAGL